MDAGRPGRAGARVSNAPLEIERVWVLTAAPTLPAGHEVWQIEQGYLPGSSLDQADFAEGRIRRITHPDGSVACVHTVKRGGGLVRQENERPIDADTFERLWPSTAGRRICKRRHRVEHGGLVWEVDQFLDWPLWMAEVELPDADHVPQVPAWLGQVLGREVTHDPRWRNFALAVQGPPEG
jgi:adenylate cyclase